MEETEVLREVAERLNDLEYVFFVDSGYPESVVADLSESFENCRINRTITIGKRIPDIIGFTNQRDIFAVEVKGDSAIRKGIGQAAHYRQGVHTSYLAADRTALSEFRETALSCGLGLFAVDSSGRVERDTPVTNIGATDIDRTRRALAVKTSRFQSDQNSFPPTSRPEKSLLPVITIATEQPDNRTISGDNDHTDTLSREKCERVILESEDTFNQAKNAISLAITLQLIRRTTSGPGGARLKLTDVGKSAYYLLAGFVESREQTDLFKYINSINRVKFLYQDIPEISAYLRDRYLSVPDIRLLVYVLASHNGSEAELTNILSEIALASPDAFLNLFCGRGKDQQFRELIEDAEPDPKSIRFREDILDLAASNALYNFVYQIRAVGILAEGTDAVHQNEDPEVGTHYWKWDSELIGEIGAESF